jgi:tol-pal system protein YbgF
MTRSIPKALLVSATVALSCAALLGAGSSAFAQSNNDGPGGFLGNLFGGGDRANGDRPQGNPGSPGDLVIRVERLEAQIRQLTGTIEQLQFRNQQLADELRRVEDGAAPGQPRPLAQATGRPTVPPAQPGQRDVFDPTQNPNAPGAPRTLGSLPVGNGPPGPVADDAQLGPPGGRAAGEPLNLATMSSNGTGNPAGAPPVDAGAGRGAVGGGTQVATLPPSDSPKDNYDLAYGYILHKDYALAEDGFRSFLKKFPSDRLVPDAEYWLGESLFQRQRYRDAAESFLNVSTKFETAAKAPDSLLRLGQSLAALGEKDVACATFGEVLRKYPKAALSVRQGVDREQKRAGC